MKNKVHYKMYIELTPREAVTSKKYWPYHYKLTHMGNIYKRTNNIGIITAPDTFADASARIGIK